jgi:serine/threonine-protein kinase
MSSTAIKSPFLTDSRARWIQLGWFLLASLAIGMFLGDIPYNFAQAAQISPELAAVLQRANLSPLFPVYLRIFQQCILFSGFGLVAGLIFVRRGRDPVALLIGLMLILTAFIYTGTYPRSGLVMLIAVGLTALGETFQVIFFWTFPDGEFRPRWVRWLILPLYLFRFAIWLNIYLNNAPQGAIEVGIVIGLILIGVRSQIYRYRKLSTPVQRQQLKWFLIGVITTAVTVTIYIYIVNISTSVTQNSNYFLFALLQTIRNLALLAVPITLAFSILRYRLWDIDLTINRSLVYTGITLVLIGLFAIAFFVMQRLFLMWVGDTQPGIAGAFAALICGMMFNPTRRAVRNFIDRRVYGFRFDLLQLDRAQQKPTVTSPSARTGQMIGQYEMLDILGKGGMGEVYKGFGDGQVVAIKLLPENLAENQDMRERFLRESKALELLSHPGIVKLYAARPEHRPPYMVIEYIDGETLSNYLVSHGVLQMRTVLQIMGPILSALDYVHAQGIIHRDLKPGNIMLRVQEDKPLAPILMDFGLVKFRASESGITGADVIGTIDYMAPEQIQTAENVDQRADLYAVGIICYEMLTGTKPFQGTPGQVLFGHLQQPVPDPRKLRADLPVVVRDFLMRALAKTPADRFQTALQMLDAFEIAVT